ncbi:MAG: SIMPL domain-containing protein [Proteobacteria bacterium]|nr:SIMPL domain-containing protein [Pseudomonadota bacterium]
MRRHLLPAAALALAAIALPGAARAEDTKLSLTEGGAVMVHPDELEAVLRAEAAAPTAAQAQREVNTAMAAALAAAKAANGITTSTGGYSVYRDGSAKPERWVASQTLNLTGKDGSALLSLVGTLQQKGLAMSDLHWQLAEDTEAKARDEALKKALTALRARADEVAGLIGLTFVRYQNLRVDMQNPVRPMPRMMAMTASMAAAAPPPSAEGQDVPVRVVVSAEAVLAPK